MKTVSRFGTRLCILLACVAGMGWAAAVPAVAAPAAAPPVAARAIVAQAVTVRFTELADQFGPGATTVTVVASKSSGTDCLKIRWSLLLQVQGVRLDQIEASRFEDTGPFPVTVTVSGNAARLTDIDPDPGTLCLNRTVTARYRLVFSPNVTAGRIQLTTEAYDNDLHLLERASATRAVGGQAPAPSAEPTVGAAGGPEPAPAVSIAVKPLQTAGAGLQPLSNGGPGLLAIGIALGGLLFLLGLSVLLKLLWRSPRRRVSEVEFDDAGIRPAMGRHRRGGQPTDAPRSWASQWADPLWTTLAGSSSKPR